MNYIKAYDPREENLFTDLSLILTDGTSTLTMNVHKIILYLSCPYFEKLLTNFREKDATHITIEVENIYVAYDIIMAFYNQKTNLANLPYWEHLLTEFKCRDFFGFRLDSELLSDLKVPDEGFELLLDIIELVGYNENTIKSINDNLPGTYDISNFSSELINAICKISILDSIVYGGSDRTIKIQNIETGAIIRTIDINAIINSLCVSLNNKQIATNRFDNNITIWDAVTGELLHTLVGPTEIIWCLCYSPNNKQIASGSGDNNIYIWHAKTGKLKHTLKNHTSLVNSICYSPDNKKIVSGGWDKIINIWNAKTGELIRTLVGHIRGVDRVRYSYDNKQIASGSSDKNIKLWNSETGMITHTLTDHTLDIMSVCYSSDNKQLASGSMDNYLKIWNTQTGELIYTFRCNARHVCYSRYNDKIISIGCDKKIRILDAKTGQLIRELTGRTKYVSDFCYLHNNDRVLEKIE
jgi:WD40 repeat protein